MHFADAGWETIASDWCAWWVGELERPLIVIECLEPKDAATPHYASTFLGNYDFHLPSDELLERFIPRLEATHYLGDAFPRFWPNFGPGIVAAFAGAGLQAVPDTTWFTPASAGGLACLQIGFQEGNAWWQRVKEVTQTAVELWGSQVCIGFTDLGGNLDILAHLRGTQHLLADLLDYPDEIERLVWETNRLWLKCYDGLYPFIRQSRGITCWGPCWSPTRGYLLQSDFAYMISPKMFERYVMPDLSACCEALDFSFYHLDGKGQLAHLDMLLSLERLRGIQWVPGDGQSQAEHWIPLIKRILDRGKLCQIYAGAEGALSILRELDGKGLLIAINEILTPEQGKALLEEVHLLQKAF